MFPVFELSIELARTSTSDLMGGSGALKTVNECVVIVLIRTWLLGKVLECRASLDTTRFFLIFRLHPDFSLLLSLILFNRHSVMEQDKSVSWIVDCLALGRCSAAHERL